MVSGDEPRTRRQVLGASGALLTGSFLAGCAGSARREAEGAPAKSTRTARRPRNETATATETEPESSTTAEEEPIDPARISLRKLGQTTLSARSDADGDGGFSEVAVRPDGRYAVLGTKWGTDGSYLVDLKNPTAPTPVHYLPNSNGSPNMDVKVHYRKGLYYRTIERDEAPGTFEIVDYGYRVGTPKNPEVVATVEGPDTHNLEPHPTEPLLYTVNYYDNEEGTNGFEIYEVRDPSNPRKIGAYGPAGYCHDITVDPKHGLLHCAYQGGSFTGFVFFDISNPRRPVEVGRFDYDERPDYDEVPVGQPGFDSAHNTDFDPRRELLYAGDERPYGKPGGKHVLDVGWRDGSISNPIAIGYTLSPNAKAMERDPDGDGEDEFTQRLDWTGHHFDVVPYDERTLLVSADWHDGVVVYDVTDPTNPHPIDRYATVDGAGTLSPNDRVSDFGDPPMAWNAEYNPARALVVVSDSFSGLYTFELIPPRR